MTAMIIGACPNPHREWSWERGSARRMKTLCGRELPWINLYEVEPSRWLPRDAALRAKEVVQRVPTGTLLILLGGRVCHAFGIGRPVWLKCYSTEIWQPVLAVPHPSGLNRWWNDPANTERAARLLSAVARGYVPQLGQEG
jgi:hypothetical protein